MPDAIRANLDAAVVVSRRRRRCRADWAALSVAVAIGFLAFAGVPALVAAQQRDTSRAGGRDTTRAGAVRDTVRAAPRTRADSLAAATDTSRAAAVRGRQRVRNRRPAPRTGAIPDSLLRPPVSPRRAFLYSLAIPGEGQTALRRPRAAALFGTIELATIAMIFKSQNDLKIAKARKYDSVSVVTGVVGTDTTFRREPDPLVARIRARRLHVEDWLATLLFNHLFSGADAFVAAQLWDLPAQVSFRPMPRGVSVSASIPW